MDRIAISRWVLDEATAEGFALAGIAPAAPSPHADYVRQWIAEGQHGEMAYLDTHLDIRLDPGRLVEGARSVIVVADRYASSDDSNPPPPAAVPRGHVARYAWGDDYHKVIKKRLHTLCDALAKRFPADTFRAAVDTAPVMEREFATAAGMGWIGKHTLLIHPSRGSWFLLGVIVTTLDIATSEEMDYPGHTAPPADHCGTCTRCIDACPTDAIAPAGYQLDARRCISYLTLEHRSLIDAKLHEGMGDWIAGCDICQAVCPYNRVRNSEKTGQEPRSEAIHPAYAPRNSSFDLIDLLNWSAEDRQHHFRGSALKRMKLDMVKRNALIAAANALRVQDHPALRERIDAIARDAAEHALVRDTARHVIEDLPPAPAIP